MTSYIKCVCEVARIRYLRLEGWDVGMVMGCLRDCREAAHFLAAGFAEVEVRAGFAEAAECCG